MANLISILIYWIHPISLHKWTVSRMPCGGMYLGQESILKKGKDTPRQPRTLFALDYHLLGCFSTDRDQIGHGGSCQAGSTPREVRISKFQTIAMVIGNRGHTQAASDIQRTHPGSLGHQGHTQAASDIEDTNQATLESLSFTNIFENVLIWQTASDIEDTNKASLESLSFTHIFENVLIWWGGKVMQSSIPLHSVYAIPLQQIGYMEDFLTSNQLSNRSFCQDLKSHHDLWSL